MRLFLPVFTLGVSLTCIVSCNSKTKSASVEKPDALASNMDTTVSPGEDFFMYANGGWIRKNPIPDAYGSWSIAHLVIEENNKRLREIAEKAASSNAAKGSTEQKIGDFWAMAMDSAKIEADGIKPLQPLLDKVHAISDVKSLVATVAELKKAGSSTLFSNYVTQDDKNSEKMTYKLVQGGIGLGDREYYFKTDSNTVNIRNKYVEYMATMLTLAGEQPDSAAAIAKRILALETQLAKASRKLEDLRDPHANYHLTAIADLGKLNSHFEWKNFLEQTGVKAIDSVIVGQPEFFRELDHALVKIPLADWKSYVKFNVVSDFSAALPDTFGRAAFQFNRLLTGARARRERWKRSIEATENVLGEAMGQLYVKEFFNETAKKRYEHMVEDIRAALKDRIAKLSWMSDSTKQKAYVKLASMKKKVGYPEKWKDMSTMEVGRESYLQNLVNANTWWSNYELNKLGKPVDRDEWGIFPQTYNAYYSPSNNEIVLPAGIFTVPGYRDEELDDATVYGYAGASTIGHEITHGFDDEGRQYDEKGNLVSWWTTRDEQEFKKRAEVMVKQFDAYEPLPGFRINGRATLGENIADLGGILLGIEAYKKTDEYKAGKTVAGLTPMQRYFCGYALGWTGHIRDEQLRNRLMTDVHSPAKYRVNGPFMDVDEFYTTFNVKPGDKMYLADSLRVKIW